MNSRHWLAAVVMLAVLGEGAWFLTRRSWSPDAVEAPALERAAASNVIADPPRVLLPIPEPAPKSDDAVTAPQGADETQRATAPPPPPQDFESKYKLKSLEQLEAAHDSISRKLVKATTARLDELWPKFPELLARGEYGARVVEPEAPIAYKGRGPWASKGEVLITADGSRVRHYLEFDVSEEPATAALCAEKDWLRSRISNPTKNGW